MSCRRELLTDAFRLFGGEHFRLCKLDLAALYVGIPRGELSVVFRPFAVCFRPLLRPLAKYCIVVFALPAHVCGELRFALEFRPSERRASLRGARVLFGDRLYILHSCALPFGEQFIHVRERGARPLAALCRFHDDGVRHLPALPGGDHIEGGERLFEHAAHRLQRLQEFKLSFPCRKICRNSLVGYNTAFVERIDNAVHPLKIISEFEAERGDLHKAIRFKAAFQPFFRIFVDVSARVLHFDAQFFCDRKDKFRLLGPLPKIFRCRARRTDTFFQEFGNERIERRHRALF